MSQRQTVLITGVTGRIGRVIVPMMAAEDRWELRSGHRRDDPSELSGFPHPVRCVIEDRASVRAALEGVDTVVHLAANSWDAAFCEEMVPNNLIGPLNLCEAALEAGCRRILFASTNHTVYNWLAEGTAIDEHADFRPDNLYGVTKAYGEVLGRFFVERRGLPSFFSLRIGWFLAPDARPLTERWPALHMWLSPRDCVQLLNRAIAAPVELGYRCFHAISDNDRQLMLIDAAKAELGYAPEDNSERYVPRFTGAIPEFLIRRRQGPT